MKRIFIQQGDPEHLIFEAMKVLDDKVRVKRAQRQGTGALLSVQDSDFGRARRILSEAGIRNTPAGSQ
jgi:hypothetical protein